MSVSSVIIALLQVACLGRAERLDAPNGSLRQVGGRTVLMLRGSHYEMGKAHGRLLRERIRRNVRALVRATKPKPPDSPRRRQGRPAWRDEELRGIAEGAGVAAEDIDRLQSVLSGSKSITGSQWCVLRKKAVGGKPIHVTSAFWKTPSNAAPKDGTPDATGPILAVFAPRQGHGYCAILPFAGAIGCWAGMNEAGISVTGVQVAVAKNEEPASGTALLIRETLHKASSIDQAVAAFRNAPRCGGAIVLLADGKTPAARVLEASSDRFVVFGPNDTAESHGPFSPLPDCLRRGPRFVDAQLAGKFPHGSHSAYNAITRFLNSFAQPLTIADAASRPVSSSERKDRLPLSGRGIGVRGRPLTYKTIFSPSDGRFWLGGLETTTSQKPSHQALFDLHALLAAARTDGKLSDAKALATFDAADERLDKGVVQPNPRPGDRSLPEIYRINGEPFAFEVAPLDVSGGVIRSKVRFPSPVKTEHPVNNTVHAELFRPHGAGPFPCVITLHITGGDFALSRFVSQMLAQKGVAALFVKMPYYGERRPPGSKIRMVSGDLERGLQSMRQTVLDLRRTCDWIEACPGLDGKRIGVMGISLGGITGSLASAIEPRISHACIIMGGAELQHVLYESTEREARKYKKLWTEQGGTREAFGKIMAPFDPATYADRLKDRIVFMISARHDRVIPKKSTLALWDAAGRQRIQWYPCGHYSMARYLLAALGQSTKFFQQWPQGAPAP